MNELEGHTVKRFDSEITSLHMRILEMGGLVSDQLKKVIFEAICEKNLDSARHVILRDNDVDKLEMVIDEEVTQILARRSPVARDLRTVMAVSKLVSDLERAGDEICKIANLTLQIYENGNSEPGHNLIRDIFTMGKLVNSMLDTALHIFDTLDAEKAKNTAFGHDELNEEFQSSLRRLYTFVMEDSRNVGYAIKIALITKSLERIGELADSILDYVIYLVEGKDIRHQVN